MHQRWKTIRRSSSASNYTPLPLTCSPFSRSSAAASIYCPLFWSCENNKNCHDQSWHCLWCCGTKSAGRSLHSYYYYYYYHPHLHRTRICPYWPGMVPHPQRSSPACLFSSLQKCMVCLCCRLLLLLQLLMMVGSGASEHQSTPSRSGASTSNVLLKCR